MKAIPALAAILAAQSIYGQVQPTQTPATRGTINILVANSHGMVLVTDSRGTKTNSYGQIVGHRDDSPKLFKLDDKTMCSIAGFAASPGRPVEGEGSKSEPPLDLAAAGVIRGYAGWLKTAATPVRFLEKVDMLSQAMENRLVGFQTANYRARVSFQPMRLLAEPNIFQLLCAGYDLDGSPRISKRTVVVTEEANTEGSFVYKGTIKGADEIIKKEMRFFFAGVEELAENRIRYPQRYQGDLRLGAYASAAIRKTTPNYSIREMIELASDIEKEVAEDTEKMKTPVVGGPIQVGVAHSGKVELKVPEEIKQDHEDDSVANFVINEVLQQPELLGFVFLTPAVHVNTTCKGSGVFIDKAVLVGGHFEDCNLYFNGKRFYRDPYDVAIVRGKLIFGPAATDQSLAEARSLLPEVEFERYDKNLPDHAWVCSLLWSCKTKEAIESTIGKPKRN